MKVFTAEAIRTHPDIQMTRGGLLLFALVSGGDYDEVRNNAISQTCFGDPNNPP